MISLEVDTATPDDSMQSQLGESIIKGGSITLRTYTLDGKAAEVLGSIIAASLGNKVSPNTAISTAFVAKELVTNAIKANMRHLLSIQTERGEDEVRKQLLLALASGDFKNARMSLVEAGLAVEIMLDRTVPDIFRLTVRNGYSSDEAERLQLTNRLIKAQDTPDLREIFAKNRATAEGGGLGVALILKSMQTAGATAENLKYLLDEKSRLVAEAIIPI